MQERAGLLNDLLQLQTDRRSTHFNVCLVMNNLFRHMLRWRFHVCLKCFKRGAGSDDGRQQRARTAVSVCEYKINSRMTSVCNLYVLHCGALLRM